MTGVMRAFNRSRWAIVCIAFAISLAMLTGAAGQAAAAVRPKLSEEGKKRRPKAPETRPVEGRPVKLRKLDVAGQSGTPVSAKPPKPSWPGEGEGTADLAKAAAPGQRAAAPWVRAGKLPIWLSAPTPRAGAKAPGPVPPKIIARIVGRGPSKAPHTDGLMLTLNGGSAGRVKVGLNYASFRAAHGVDWASRLRLVKLPVCALTSPARRECQAGTPLPTANDQKAGTLVADVDLPAATQRTGSEMVLAAEAGPSGPGGDWTATKLTAASNWNAGSNTGEFSWNYPVRMPPVPGELLPEVTLGYSSSGADGKTAADNSQASWVGDGFDYWPGFIERKYKACTDDGQVSGDLCWGRQNATMMLNGRSAELIWDSTAGFWRPKNDDGSKVEKLTGAANGDEGDSGDSGEWWRLTTLDGTQYVFGKDRPDDWSTGKPETNSAWTVPVFGDDSGEPCHKSTFKDGYCNQVWRWNLDHVIDPHKNTITYYYEKETNNYTRVEQFSGGTKYVSGGHLKRIDFGQRQGSTYGALATARVRFDVADRTDFPDDQVCADNADCGLKKLSPTFFDRKRLTKITTELRNDAATGKYDAVDSWELGQTYQNGVLWLNTIKQVGEYGGAVAAPVITLQGALLTNRVVSTQGGTGQDAMPAYYRPRLTGINNGSGGTTTVNYSDPYPLDGSTPPGECRFAAGAMPDPKTNPKRCFPVKWRSPDGKIIDDWYHKYVVTSVRESVGDTAAQTRDEVTGYSYLGAAAWRYTEDDGLTKDKWRNWSQWRGYSKVRTSRGDGQVGEQQTRTETTYARGMDGNYQGKGQTPQKVSVSDSKDLIGGSDGIADIDALAGTVIETRTYGDDFSDDAEQTASVSKPKWVKTATRTFKDTITDDDITVNAGWGKPEWTKQRSRKADGSTRNVETFYDYNGLGQTVAVDDEGDPGTSSDDTCTRTVFPFGAPPANTVVIRSLPVRDLKVAADCDDGASSEPNLVAADMISDVKTVYDSGQYGDHPTVGEDRQIETVTGVQNGRSTVAKTVTNVHDRYGRITSTTQVGDPAVTTDDRTTTTSYTDAPEGWLKTSAVTTPPVSVSGAAAAGFTTTTVFNPGRGTATKVTDPNNRVAEAVYDGLGRLVKAWLPNRPRSTNPDSPSTQYTYAFPANGNPVSVTTKTLRQTDPITYNTSVELLDGMLRPRQSQTQAAITGERLVSDTFYDSRGQVFKANAPHPMTGTPSGELIGTPDSQVPSQTVTAYDPIGRPTVSALFSKGTKKWQTTTQYQGEQTIVIPPSGATPTMSITDARGRTVETRQYKSATLPAGGAYVSSYSTFDGAGRPSELKDAAGNTWKTTYDVQGRPQTSSDPDKGLSELTYDNFDQIRTTKDARGTTLTHSYDKLGRKLEVKNGAAVLTSYSYDNLALGLPTSSTRNVGANAYTVAVKGYDTMYRPTGSTTTIPASDGFGTTTSFTSVQSYNFDGTPRTTQYPSIGGAAGLPLENVTTEYNDKGLPSWNSGLATYIAGTTYNSYGEVTQLSAASVSDRFIWQTFERNEATKQLTRSTVKRQSSATYDNDTSYRYTDSGSLYGIENSTDRQCFTYDYAQRLKESWTTSTPSCSGAAPTTATIGGPSPYWTSYEYDQNGEKTGNRTKEVQHAFSGGPTADKTRTYGYPADPAVGGNNGPHALRSVTETQAASSREDLYTYDQAGNTTVRPGQKLEWDAEGHLSRVTDTAGTELASFVYDASGNRLIRKDTNGKTLYLPGQELKISSSGATSATRYYSHAGQTVAYRTSTATSSVQFLLPDYQGTTSITINAVDQNTYSQRWFAPFGTERPTGAIGGWPGAMDKGFVEGTKDATTKLTHLGAREYDPTIGRFASVDPIFAGGDPSSWNGFNYTSNNPIDDSDPSGTCSEFAGCPHHPEAVCGNSCDTDHGGTPRDPSGNPIYNKPNYPPVKPPCTSWKCKVGGFLKKHSATIASVAVGVGCGFAIGWTGVGGAACAVAAGAVYGAVNHAQRTPMDQWSATGFLKAAAVGAAVGLITHGVTGLASKAAAPLLRRVVPKIAAKIASGAKGLRGGGKGCNSFVPDTKVVMADGTRKPIDHIRVGDKVLATDPGTGATRKQTVLSTVSSLGSKRLVQVTVDTDGKRGTKTGIVIATDNHPFWVPAQKQWTDAGRLKPGKWLRTAAGTHVQITAIKAWTQHQHAHNLTVDTDHTYYVLAGVTPVLVHNTAGCGPVPYGSTDASKIAIKHRQQAGIPSGQNVAVYSVDLPNGQTANLAFTNTVRGAHSEAHADDFLAELGIDPSAVSAIYSERNFCTTAGHLCAGRMSKFTDATLSWSFERGDNAQSAIRRAVFG